MKLFKSFAAALSLAVLCMLAVPRASADDWNRETIVTFSAPVEVPGVGAQTLPAGTYIFKILDNNANRHIVQILNQDKTHVFTTILAIPNVRLKTTDKTTITFSERPAGQPEALKAWFYPGRDWGEEFVYTKSRAMELAKETNEPVLATSVEMAAAPVDTLKTLPIEAVGAKGEPVELTKVVEAPPAAIEPAPVVAAAAPAVEPQMVATNTLPKTASSMPLIALFGFLSLSVGFGLKLASKRDA